MFASRHECLLRFSNNEELNIQAQTKCLKSRDLQKIDTYKSSAVFQDMTHEQRIEYCSQYNLEVFDICVEGCETRWDTKDLEMFRNHYEMPLNHTIPSILRIDGKKSSKCRSGR